MEAPEVEAPRMLPEATLEETRRAPEKLVATPSADRLFHLTDAMRIGLSDAELYALTAVDPFAAQIRRLVAAEEQIKRGEVAKPDAWLQAPRLRGSAAAASAGRGRRARGTSVAGHAGCLCASRHVAAEFVAHTPYLY
jgi:carbamoyl-phosphate synthase large subunit